MLLTSDITRFCVMEQLQKTKALVELNTSIFRKCFLHAVNHLPRKTNREHQLRTTFRGCMWSLNLLARAPLPLTRAPAPARGSASDAPIKSRHLAPDPHGPFSLNRLPRNLFCEAQNYSRHALSPASLVEPCPGPNCASRYRHWRSARVGAHRLRVTRAIQPALHRPEIAATTAPATNQG